MKSNLYLLKRIRPFPKQNFRKYSVIVFCNSYVHTHLDYICTVWCNTTQENLKKLFQQQERAARLLFDDWDSSYSELFSKLNWLPIDRRIVHNKLILVYKALHNVCPQYFAKMVQYQINNVDNMRSTAQVKLLAPRPKYETLKQNVFLTQDLNFGANCLTPCIPLGHLMKLRNYHSSILWIMPFPSITTHCSHYSLFLGIDSSY